MLHIANYSVQFSHSVVSNSLQSHGLQHARICCPSPTPGACWNLCPSSRWCHPTISSSVVPSSACPKSFPASGTFQMSRLFASGGQSIGVSASISVLPMYTQDWSSLGCIGCISLQSKGLSRVFSNTTGQNYQFFYTWLLNSSTLTSMHVLCFDNQLCPTLCNPMDCSTLGFPFLHCLPDYGKWGSSPTSFIVNCYFKILNSKILSPKC